MRFETLEPRLLLSADLLPDGVLHIVGTEADDSVLLRQFDPPTGDAPLLEVVLNGESFEFKLAEVDEINAALLGGNDELIASVAADIDWDLTLSDGNDRTQIEVRIGDQFADARYRIDAGDGDNKTEVLFGDGVHGAVPPSDQTSIITEYRSGAGNDGLTFGGLAHLDRDLYISADAVTGAGDDSIAWEHQFEFRPGKWAQTDYNFELGDGNNQFEADLLNPVGQLSVAGGAGNDFMSAQARWDAGAGDQVLDFSALFQSGAGNDEVSLDLIVSPRDPASELGGFLDVSTGVDLGPGMDLSRISTSMDATRWLAQLAVNVVDFVDEDEITTEFNTTIAAQAEDGMFDLDITGRDGNDTVELNVEGTFDEFNALIGTGEGDDEIRHKFFSIVDRSRISIHTGGGNDLVDSNVSAIWLTTGFFEVNAGDGDNVVNLNVASAIPPEGAAFHNPKSFQIISASGNDTVNASFIDALFDIDFMADTGEGDDSLALSFLGTLGQIDFTVDAGAGNDTANTVYVSTAGGGVWKTFMGDGNDRTAHEIVHTIQQGASTQQTRQLTVIQDMGPGDDIAQLVVDSEGPTPGETLPEVMYDFIVLGGSGADQVFARVSNPVPAEGGADPEDPDETRSRASLSIDTGSDDDVVSVLFNPKEITIDKPVPWQVEIQSGGGDDTIGLLLPAVQKVREAAARVHVDGGEGEDALSIDTGDDTSPVGGFFRSVQGLDSETEVVEYQAGIDDLVDETSVARIDLAALETLSVQTGAGPDQIFIDLDHPSAPVPALNFNTGGGDDAIEAVFVGVFGGVAFNLDTGTGNDTVDVRVTEAEDIVTGPGAGAVPQVKEFSGASGAEIGSLLAYTPSFTGGVRVAVGDVNGDGFDDVVTGTGPGAGPHVKVFDGVSGAEIRSFFAYAPTFTGGVFVAAGDVNGDGADDIITGADAGAALHVKVFDGATGAEIRSFLAYSPVFTGGVRVAAGDVNGDGLDDIITGTGPGAGPHVKVFDGVSGAEIRSFFAYAPTFTGGVFVAAGDIDGDGRDDLITGTDAGAAPHVKVFSGASGAEIRSFFAYAPAFTGGVRVAVGDVNGDGFDDIITGAGPGAGPHVKVFDGQSGAEIRSFFAYDPSFTGGVFVASGDVTGERSGRPGAFSLTIDTGEGNDRAQLSIDTGIHPLYAIELDMGTGADRVALDWHDAALDEAPELRASVQVMLGGADLVLPEVGDEVLVSFEHGDLNQPIVIGALWNSQDVPPQSEGEAPPEDSKSLRIELNHDGGRLDWFGELTGGSGVDSMQLYFHGKLKVGSDPFLVPRLRGMLDMGDGDDEVLVDFSGLTIEGATDQAAITFVMLGGAGNDILRVNGTDAADAFSVTDSAVTLQGAGTLTYVNFESLLVDGLGGNDTMVMTGVEADTQTTLAGGAGDDLLIGGSTHDVLVGGTGDDILIGGAGNDWIEGGEGNDALFGGFGNDTLLGGPGRDVLVGGPGKDVIDGGGNAALVGDQGGTLRVGAAPARQRASR